MRCVLVLLFTLAIVWAGHTPPPTTSQQLDHNVIDSAMIYKELHTLRHKLDNTAEELKKVVDELRQDITQLRADQATCHINTEWQIAMRSTPGTRVSLYDLWMSSDGLNGDDCSLFTSDASVKGVAKTNDIDTLWPSVDKVRMVIMKDGQEAAWWEFKAISSTKESWMSPSRYVDSSYADMSSTRDYRIFSVSGITIGAPGLQRSYRRFHMASQYASCPGDLGWLVVEDEGTSTGRHCDWDKRAPYPYFLFSTLSTAQLADDQTEGDVFLIYIHLTDDSLKTCG